MSGRVRSPALWFAGGIAAAVVVAVLAVALVTRTDRGRAVVLGYTLTALGGRLNGELVVNRLDGSLFTGARLYGISLHGQDGEPLLVADSAFIEYDLPTFVGGDVVIDHLVVYDAEVLLRRAPGDSLWNYQEILQNPAPGGGPGRATLIERLRLVNADVVVRLPWAPDEELSERVQEQQIERALADTSRLVVERVAGGLMRTIRLGVVEAVAAPLSIASDERGGTYAEVEGGAAEILLYQDEPLRLVSLQGELALREGVLRYDAPTIALPGSSVASAGVVDVTGGEPRYDLVVHGEEVALQDLQWLYPPIPDRGSVGGRLWLETRPEGLFFLVRDGRLSAPDTRVAGDFGLVIGDTLRFVEVDLTADPLNVETVRQMIPAEIPVRGLRIGAVDIESPAS